MKTWWILYCLTFLCQPALAVAQEYPFPPEIICKSPADDSEDTVTWDWGTTSCGRQHPTRPTYGTPEWPGKWSGEKNAVIGKCWSEIEFCENEPSR